MKRRAWLPAVIAVGVVVLVTVGWTIHSVAHKAPTLAASNTQVFVSGLGLEVKPGQQRCQDHDWVPDDARTARVFVDAGPTNAGPPLEVTFAGSNGSPAFRAEIPAGYPSGPLDVPIDPPATIDPATVCIRNLGSDSSVFFGGNLTLPANMDAAAALRGGPIVMKERDTTGAIRGDDIRMDFFTDHSGSFFTEASTIAERFALYKPGFAGDALIYVALGAFVVIAGVGTWLAIRVATKTVAVRTAVIVVAAVAVGHAWVWALTTPPNQVPDEGSHILYVDYLSATHHLPPLHPNPDSNAVVPDFAILFDSVAFSATEPTNWDAARDAALRASLRRYPHAANASTTTYAAPGSAGAYPPLYYAYEAVPARLLQPVDALNRFYFLRLWSGLLLGVTALGVFWFLSEALPSRPATWIYGSLAVALLPLAGFMAGGINNDNLMYAESALLIALAARVLRRGVDRFSALALAVLGVAGLFTKPTIAALFPGIALALVVAMRRHRGSSWRPLVEATALGAALFAASILFINRWSGRSFGEAVGFSGGTELSSRAGHIPMTTQLSYVWQYYLPKLWFQTRPVAYLHYPVYDVYWRGFVGAYGYFAFGFSYSVMRFALVLALGVVALAIATLVFERRAVRRRWADLLVYGVLTLSTLVFVASVGLRQLVATKLPFEQTRYLLPLLALYGGVIALAAAYRRSASFVGPALVAIAGAHAWFSLLLTIRHYYT